MLGIIIEIELKWNEKWGQQLTVGQGDHIGQEVVVAAVAIEGKVLVEATMQEGERLARVMG